MTSSHLTYHTTLEETLQARVLFLENVEQERVAPFLCIP